MVAGSKKTADLTPRIGADDVRVWLEANPDFLAENPELIKVMTPPAQELGRSVVDFQHFMLHRLRDEFARTREQQRVMVANARANLHAQSRVQAAVLSLIEARSLADLIETLTVDLAAILDVDAAILVVESNGLEPPHVHRSGIRVVAPGEIDAIMQGRETRLDADIDGDAALFGEAAGLVASQALIRLEVSRDTPVGLLALGSRNPDMFADGQATELLRFLAGAVERLLRGWLDLPE